MAVASAQPGFLRRGNMGEWHELSRGMVDVNLEHDQRDSIEGGLPFIIDDLAASLPHATFPRRVVCHPFPVQVVPAQRGSALERMVRQLIQERVASEYGAGSSMPSLAAYLRCSGLRVHELDAPAPLAHTPLTTRSPVNDQPFLVVCGTEVELQSTGLPGELVVVDASLRELLAVAPATPSYAASLATHVPELFVGSRDRLTELISAMATAISANFSTQGIDLPPWRRKTALLSRWANLEARVRLQQQLAEEQQQQQGELQTQTGAHCEEQGQEQEDQQLPDGRVGNEVDTLEELAQMLGLGPKDGANDTGGTAAALPWQGPARQADGFDLPQQQQQHPFAPLEQPILWRLRGTDGAERAGRSGSTPRATGVRRNSSVPSIVIVGFQPSGHSSGSTETVAEAVMGGHQGGPGGGAGTGGVAGSCWGSQSSADGDAEAASPCSSDFRGYGSRVLLGQ